MNRSIILLGLVSAFALHAPAAAQWRAAQAAADRPAKGLSAVNVPVVTRADYMRDLAAPDGSLGGAEAARLDGWFRSMELGYGDVVYVDGASGPAARDDVARVAGQYGMLVSLGAPMTAGAVSPGMVRVVVARTVAMVPNCPNWSKAPTPNFDNSSMSGFGCGVNGNLAAMIANPQDLVHGRQGSGVGDARTSVRAVEQYRTKAPTGSGGLQAVNTKGQ